MIYGLAEDDTIFGNAGNDEIWGGPGDDIIDGGEGWDWVSYGDLELSGGITVDIDPGDGLAAEVSYEYGNDEYDTLYNIEGFRDTDLDDTFIAGVNASWFEGGSGNDTFIFTDSTQIDTILDFTAENDGENDLLVFDELELEFDASGNNEGSNYANASRTGGEGSQASTEQFEIIGVTDLVNDFNNLENVASVIDDAVIVIGGDAYENTYFIASDGSDAGIYY